MRNPRTFGVVGKCTNPYPEYQIEGLGALNFFSVTPCVGRIGWIVGFTLTIEGGELTKEIRLFLDAHYPNPDSFGKDTHPWHGWNEFPFPGVVFLWLFEAEEIRNTRNLVSQQARYLERAWEQWPTARRTLRPYSGFVAISQVSEMLGDRLPATIVERIVNDLESWFARHSREWIVLGPVIISEPDKDGFIRIEIRVGFSVNHPANIAFRRKIYRVQPATGYLGFCDSDFPVGEGSNV